MFLNRIFRLIKLALNLVSIGIIFISSLQAKENQVTKENLKFILVYETFEPLILKNCILYVSPEKITGISDSVPSYISNSGDFNDTIYIKYPWKFPVHA